ncbi:uncharacterized protein LOC126780419 isoform X2 [Nymphalis io]|uniref:uncharacterized protein LOC126780419 isoform X2 n=1 Tax=Inachis io TaxID=171585 RepID=UPI002166D209|nr:uncharacterized protein LOC126780419 isoform X2 [Nymphalis io]
MSDKREKEVNIQDSNSESSSDGESAPPASNTTTYVADNSTVDSLVAKIYYYLSVESDQDDEEVNSSPTPPDAPPEPSDEQDGNAEDEVVGDIDDKISKIEGLENLVVNSPSWFLHVKPHLTKEELKELWERTPWGIKWFWDENGDDDEDEYGNQERGRYIIQAPFF